MTVDGAPGAAPLARRAAAVAGTRLVLVVVGTVVSVLIARTLGPAGRGEYAFVVTVTGTAVALAHLSVEQAQVYLVSLGVSVRQLASNAVVLALLLGMLAMSVVALASAGVAYPFDGSTSEVVEVLALVNVPLMIMGLYANNGLVLSGRTDLLNRTALIGGGVQCALLVVLAAVGRMTVLAVLVAWTLSSLLPLVISLPALRPSRGQVSLPLARRELAVGLRYHGGLASLYLLFRIDVLLLAAMTDRSAIGLYALAVSLVELTNVAADSVATVVVRRQATSSFEESARLTARVVGVTVLLATVAGAALVLGSPVVLPVVFGEDFSGAVPAVLALAPGVVALAASRSAGGYLVRLNRPWIVTGMAVAALGLNVAANLVLIPLWGIVGAGIATSVAYTALASGYLMWLRQSGRLSLQQFRPRIAWRAVLDYRS